MKERILFECVGQGGGNIGELFAEKDYVCHFINTSNPDLETLNVNPSLKYHIPRTFGCNKDRIKAMNYAKEYHKHITDTIDNSFPTQDIVFFVLTLGGGTGGGISPLILDYMSKKNPNKYYGAIVVMPSLKEPMMQLNNAVEAFKQIRSIENLRTLFIIDNDSCDDFMTLNERFVDNFDRLINITQPHKKGVIDGAELEELITCKGISVMGSFDIDEHKFRFKDRMFATYKTSCQYLGVSICDDTNIELIEKHFGTPYNIHKGYNDKDNFLIASGLPMYTSKIEDISKRVKSLLFDRNSEYDEEIEEINIPIIRDKETKKGNNNKVNFSDIFGKYIE
jgi:hypothetical protein